MSYFDCNEEHWRGRGALWTAREIAQQPAMWQATGALLEHHAVALEAFLRPLLDKAGLRIILTGAGSSAYIGECLQPLLLRALQRRVEAIATTDIVARPSQCLQADVPTLLVSFARSGSSPESLAAVELAQRHLKDSHQLVITCNAAGELFKRCSDQRNSFVLLLPDATHDRSFAMTSSFSSMLLAGLGAFMPAAMAPERTRRIGFGASGILGSGHRQVQALAAQPFSRVVYLGSGPLTGLAHEASLKLLELTDGGVVSLSNSPLAFRHGPKTFVNRETLVVVFISNDALARRYDLDLVRELRGDAIAGRVLALTAQSDDAAIAGDIELIPGMPTADDDELCFPYVVWAQSYAFFRALALGKTPDNPSASGTVSRVVKGVTIHTG